MIKNLILRLLQENMDGDSDAYRDKRSVSRKIKELYKKIEAVANKDRNPNNPMVKNVDFHDSVEGLQKLGFKTDNTFTAHDRYSTRDHKEVADGLQNLIISSGGKIANRTYDTQHNIKWQYTQLEYSEGNHRSYINLFTRQHSDDWAKDKPFHHTIDGGRYMIEEE